MKRFLALLVAAVMLLTLAACGTEPTSSESQPTTTTTTAAALTTTSRRSATKTSETTGVTTTTTTAKATTTTTTTTTTAPAKNLPTIVCWGDSITEGAWIERGEKYPDYLQQMVGNDTYKVWNAGYGGDSSFGIGARQGAVKLTTKNAITFKKGERTVTIGHRVDGMGLMMDDGTELTKLNVSKMNSTTVEWDYTLAANPVKIDGKTYTLGYDYEGTPKPYTDGVYYITLTRDNADGALTIPAGSAVTLANSNLAASNYCDIYLVGANDGQGATPSSAAVQDLVERYQALVNYGKTDRYLVIIPFWTDSYDAAFKQAFGDHAINFRELAVERGLQSEGLTATTIDSMLIKNGRVPASLRYADQPDQVHLNAKGYHFLASLVYEQGKTFGYWK